MRTQLMWIRALTATVLFLVLAQANVWANTQTHLVLAVGYRTFLLAAPAFVYFGISTGMRLALGLGVMSILASLFSVNEYVMGLFALSMAVTGYLAKYITSHTSQGAADNKVALNMGSLVSGVLLMGLTGKFFLLTLSAGLLLICTFLAFKIDWSQLPGHTPNSKGLPKSLSFRFLPLLGWSLVGVATGIKLTGIFTILPQYLLLKNHLLPHWFGSLVIINSLGVILVQHRVLRFLDEAPHWATHLSAASAMILLALPSIMGAEHLPSAVIWVTLLTLGECALSRYDRIAKEEGYLFPKELMVGVGSFLTVALSRHFPSEIHWSGIIGVACLMAGVALVVQRHQTSSTLSPATQS